MFVSVWSIEVETLSEDLHVLYGMGGNVAVLNTEDGTVIVDTMTFQLQDDRIKELAMELTGKPVIAVISSHYYLDHTHGNGVFAANAKLRKQIVPKNDKRLKKVEDKGDNKTRKKTEQSARQDELVAPLT